MIIEILTERVNKKSLTITNGTPQLISLENVEVFLLA